jgi:hypothetical protein
MSFDWIPARETALVALCKKWLKILDIEEILTKYRWDAGLCKIIRDAIVAYLTAVETFTNNDNTANRSAKIEAKKIVTSAMREFARTSVRNNPFMNDPLRQEFGLHIADTVSTRQPCPIIAPNTTTDLRASHLQHRVRAINPETHKNTKPAGVHGVRFVWQVGGERPANGAAMLKGQFSRKPEILVMHDEIDRGKIVYYASCYENTKGEAGPWSLVVETYIT